MSGEPDDEETLLRSVALQNATTILRARQRAEQELIEAKEALERANRAKDEFLAVVSHELRTPLNAIVGWAALLLEDELTPEKRRHAIEVIHRNAQVQTKLIDDLLDVSRIISGKVRLNVDEVEPIDVVRRAIESVKPAADAKGIRLLATLDPDAGTLMGDRDRLQQVVWNLLTNAIKFTARQGKVQVRVRRVDSSVEIVVEDDGQGISAEFMPYLFDRFRQADYTSSRSKGGLGLGLAIVRHLVELHGGSIEAESPGEGRGATFRLLLPVSPMRQSKKALVALEAPQPIRSVMPLEGLRVLVVEDEADSREMLRLLLERNNAIVTLAGSAAEALEHVKRECPDIIVSDIGMPGEDGYDLIRNVRALGGKEPPRVPAVALTAYARPSDRTQALLAGFDVHVAKPIDSSELLVVIGNLWARAQRFR